MYMIFFILFDFVFCVAHLPEVDRDKQDQYADEQDCDERTELRCKSTLAGVCVYVCGKSVQSDGSSGEECNGEVVQRHREGEDES